MLSLFMYGIPLAIFQESGKIDSSSDLLNSMVRGFETAFAAAFNILWLIKSGPLALFSF